MTYSFRQSFSLYGMQVLLFENQCESLGPVRCDRKYFFTLPCHPQVGSKPSGSLLPSQTRQIEWYFAKDQGFNGQKRVHLRHVQEKHAEAESSLPRDQPLLCKMGTALPTLYAEDAIVLQNLVPGSGHGLQARPLSMS